jgi:hypothetical protein
MLGIFEIGSRSLSRLTSKQDPHDLCLPSSYDYRREPLALNLTTVFISLVIVCLFALSQV